MNISYDKLGLQYSTTRRTDPRIFAALHTHLSKASSLLNMGAGTGNYEPIDKENVYAIEPSVTMPRQRPEGSNLAIHPGKNGHLRNHMKHLAIITTDITDPSWVEEYVEKVTQLVIACGGRYITRTDDITHVEGERKPQFCVVTEFPSKEVALTFYHSEDYSPYKTSRLSGSTSTFLLIPVENGAG